MTIMTWLRPDEMLNKTSNKEINKLVLEANNTINGGKFFCVERKIHSVHMFFIKKTVTRFELFYSPDGTTYVQQINFYRLGSDTSINTSVPADLIMAYLFGVLCGNS